MPNVTTQHGRLDLPDLVPLYSEFADMTVVPFLTPNEGPWLESIGKERFIMAFRCIYINLIAAALVATWPLWGEFPRRSGSIEPSR